MVIQFVRHPDVSVLDATVILDRLFGEIRRPIEGLKFEPGVGRLEQILLIALGREMKVSAFADDVSGRIALRMHHIGCDGVSANVELLQCRNDKPDLVGLIFLGSVPTFSWQ